jgi:hypothetical protein
MDPIRSGRIYNDKRAGQQTINTSIDRLAASWVFLTFLLSYSLTTSEFSTPRHPRGTLLFEPLLLLVLVLLVVAFEMDWTIFSHLVIPKINNDVTCCALTSRMKTINFSTLVRKYCYSLNPRFTNNTIVLLLVN